MKKNKVNKVGLKHDCNKLRLDLFPLEIEKCIARVLTMGAIKYGDENWKGGIHYKRIIGAMKRHFFQWFKDPEKLDDESGLPHIYHFLCNAIFLTYYEIYRDKYKKFDNYTQKGKK